jgi:hypothetical protein
MPDSNNLIFVVIFLFGLKLFDWGIAVSVILLPGTVAHELCHYLVGLLLNACPTRLVLWPIRSGNRLVLGEVGFSHLTWYNAAMTGMAPLLLIPLAWQIARSAGTGWHNIWMAYLEAVLLVSAIPSGTDFKVAFRFTAGPVLLFVGTFAWLVYH